MGKKQTMTFSPLESSWKPMFVPRNEDSQDRGQKKMGIFTLLSERSASLVCALNWDIFYDWKLSKKNGYTLRYSSVVRMLHATHPMAVLAGMRRRYGLMLFPRSTDGILVLPSSNLFSALERLKGVVSFLEVAEQWHWLLSLIGPLGVTYHI